jgi:shikimate kinase
MKKHLLLIGFSCTGKTNLGRIAFRNGPFLDSDVELQKWIGNKTGEQFDHIYEVFIRVGRSKALNLIERAEQDLIDKWTQDSNYKIISLGPGFPLHTNWPNLRAVSHVVLFKRSPEGIYESLEKRRSIIFARNPEARYTDNWDVGVMVDAHFKKLSREAAINNITELLVQRDRYYRDNDFEVITDNEKDALEKLRDLRLSLG